MQAGLTINARQIVDFIIRESWGYRQRQTRHLKLTDFCLALKMQKGNVSRELARLKEANMVIHTDNKRNRKYQIQRDFTQWQRLSRRITKKPKLSRRITKGYPYGEQKVIQADNQKPPKALKGKGQPKRKDIFKDNLKDIKIQDDFFAYKGKDPLLREAHQVAKPLELAKFNPHAFIESMSNGGHQSENILVCVQRLIERKGTANSLWAYGKGVLTDLANKARRKEDDERIVQYEKSKRQGNVEDEAYLISLYGPEYREKMRERAAKMIEDL